MKKISCLLVALLMIVSIAGCQPKSSDNSNKENTKEVNQSENKEEVKEDKKEEVKEDKKEEEQSSEESAKLVFALDWVPNTNHTGLYVAKDMGYFAEEGIEMDIIQPAEESSSTLVGVGKAQFGISFQSSMVKRLLKDVPITAVAAVVQHNPGGIMSLAADNINSPKDMVGKKYSTWEDPIDDATVKHLVEMDGGDWSKVELIPGESTDATTALQMNIFDSIFVFYGWDYIHSQTMGVETNFFFLKDLEPAFDYYSPVIIANNKFLAENPELAKKALRAMKKGYEFAAENPEEAAKILIANAPEGDAKLMKASQEYLSTQYIDDASSWGVIDPSRWNAFYQWLYDQKLIDKPLQNEGFSNDYLE